MDILRDIRSLTPQRVARLAPLLDWQLSQSFTARAISRWRTQADQVDRSSRKTGSARMSRAVAGTCMPDLLRAHWCLLAGVALVAERHPDLHWRDGNPARLWQAWHNLPAPGSRWLTSGGGEVIAKQLDEWEGHITTRPSVERLVGRWLEQNGGDREQMQWIEGVSMDNGLTLSRPGVVAPGITIVHVDDWVDGSLPAGVSPPDGPTFQGAPLTLAGQVWGGLGA